MSDRSTSIAAAEDDDPTAWETYTSVMGPGMRVVSFLLAVTLSLGIIAFIPQWHGGVGRLLQAGFWVTATATVLMLPLLPRAE